MPLHEFSARLSLFSGINAGGQPPAPDGPSLRKDWRQYRKPNRKRQVPHRNSCQHTAQSHHHGLACRALADEPAFHRRRGGGRGREAFTETQINALASLMADEMLVQRRICLNEERPGNLDGYRASALSAKKIGQFGFHHPTPKTRRFCDLGASVATRGSLSRTLKTYRGECRRVLDLQV